MSVVMKRIRKQMCFSKARPVLNGGHLCYNITSASLRLFCSPPFPAEPSYFRTSYLWIFQRNIEKPASQMTARYSPPRVARLKYFATGEKLRSLTEIIKNAIPYVHEGYCFNDNVNLYDNTPPRVRSILAKNKVISVGI